MGSIGRMLRSGGNSGQPESRAQLSRAELLIQEFENSGKGWFWETERDGTLTYISDSVAEAVGRQPGDLLDRPFTDLISTETEDGAATSERTLGFYLSSHVAFQDLIVRAKTKNEIWWSISGQPVHDGVGRFFGFRGFASDLTKMRQSEVELDRLARQDSLTGLANREMLRRALDDALLAAVRRKHRCSVFLLDLDRFKAVNDTLGHPAGDTLLRLVSLRLRDVIGEAGQVGRLGGDEFEIVLPSTSNKEDLSKLAQGIIDSLSRPYTINGNAVSIGASVGIVTSDYDDRTADDLMRDADLALYAAKAAGKGCFRFFAPEMHEAARERQVMESDLRVAIEKETVAGRLPTERPRFDRGRVGLRSVGSLGPPGARRGQSRARSFRSPRKSASSTKSANGCFAPLAPKRRTGRSISRSPSTSLRSSSNLMRFRRWSGPCSAKPASPPSASSWRLPRACC